MQKYMLYIYAIYAVLFYHLFYIYKNVTAAECIIMSTILLIQLLLHGFSIGYICTGLKKNPFVSVIESIVF